MFNSFPAYFWIIKFCFSFWRYILQTMVVRIKLVAADSEAEIERIQFLLAMYNMLRYELYKTKFYHALVI
jgi:hypothetical protein